MASNKRSDDLRERQRQGIARTKAAEPSKYQGRKQGAYAAGRSPLDAVQLRQQGYSFVEIAKRLNVSTKTVQRYLAPPTPEVFAHWLLRIQNLGDKKKVLALAGIQVRRGRVSEVNDALVGIIEQAARAKGLSEVPSLEFMAEVLGFFPTREAKSQLDQLLHSKLKPSKLPKPEPTVAEDQDDFWGRD